MLKFNPLYTYGIGERVEKNGQRHYVNPVGTAVPSVTTILGKTADKSHLVKWRNRIGEEEADQITKESAALGTMLHTHLEKYIKGEERPGGTNIGRILAKNMADVVINSALKHVDEVWGIESPLFYENFWAGTADLIGVYKGKPAIMDFKNTRKPKKREWIDDYRLQLTAYRMSHDLTFGTKIETNLVFMVSRDLQFQLFEFNKNDFDKDEADWVDRVAKYYEFYK